MIKKVNLITKKMYSEYNKIKRHCQMQGCRGELLNLNCELSKCNVILHIFLDGANSIIF